MLIIPLLFTYQLKKASHLRFAARTNYKLPTTNYQLITPSFRLHDPYAVPVFSWVFFDEVFAAFDVDFGGFVSFVG